MWCRRITKWIRRWGALIVAIVALGFSAYAVCSANQHYEELTKPHTQHDEIRDRLIRLDERIERAEASIAVAIDNPETSGMNVTEAKDNLGKAITLRSEAETAWDDGNYTQADKLIHEANDAVDKIPIVAHALQMYWFAIIFAGVVVIALIIILITRYISRGNSEIGGGRGE